MLNKCLIILILLYTQTLYGQGLKVVITEVMADPVPAVALPPEEYIELTNISGERIDISGWSIGTGSNPGIIPDSIILEKDSLIIICSKQSVLHLQEYGRVLGIERFPTLLNDGDTLLLYDKESGLQHAVYFNPALLPRDKRDGGWSLELVDIHRACSFQSNWVASNNSSGGSPGKPHKPESSIPPAHRFSLVHAYTTDSLNIILVFDDAVDSLAARLKERYFIEPAIPIKEAFAISPFFNSILLQLDHAMESGKIYTITARDLNSCIQEPIGILNRTKTGIPHKHPQNININEIMNDPPAGGSDYFEIHNYGDNIIDIKHLLVGTRNSRAEISSVRQLGSSSRYIFPGDYICFTTDIGWLSKQYHLMAPSQVIQIASLPSWPNETGTIVLLDTGIRVIDELKYHESWHFELVRVRDGVSLEKIDPRAPTQDKTNWHSAAMHSGYGTPGYKNSQHISNQSGEAEVWPEPSLFSPDGDGRADECQIKYSFQEAGTVSTIRIFDYNGKLQRQLVNNALCGRQGHFSWNGLDDDGNPLLPGLYIVSADVFRLTGKTKRYRFAVTLGNKYR